ncbi:hypothetical protein CKAH01_08461 [Colletotrichum kahawae]|uniref:Uncharacterized protein n=1 Tax=Colletotrichum kahawae TaxID=34407 RepID=A0AAE0D093_COLKA|nr:hypothetical protein CKAH01_08461 [Colletotrichum kahawae]
MAEHPSICVLLAMKSLSPWAGLAASRPGCGSLDTWKGPGGEGIESLMAYLLVLPKCPLSAPGASTSPVHVWEDLILRRLRRAVESRGCTVQTVSVIGPFPTGNLGRRRPGVRQDRQSLSVLCPPQTNSSSGWGH